jgi:hypothetical protein
MPEGKAADQQKDRDPEAEARAKAERIEREKQELLRDIAASTTNDLRAKVGYVLNHFPVARDSDVTLAHLVWETFYPEYIDGGRVRLEAMYHLPRQTTITRTRANIQNDYGLFQPSAEVAGHRRVLRDEKEKEVVADKPGPPVLSIHADESGKNQRFLVVGSVWMVDVGKEWRVVDALREWRREASISWELKFAELTKQRLKDAVEFVKKAMEHSDLMGLKACVLDTSAVKGLAKEDVLYRLYYELAMSGIEHEVTAGRVLLPRWLYIVKDADDGPDALLLPELERRLTAGCREYFNDKVQVDSVVTAASDYSLLLQLADLFSGSVARIFNKTGDTVNQKDEFAAFFQTVAGFDFLGEDKGKSDFVYIHRLI